MNSIFGKKNRELRVVMASNEPRAIAALSSFKSKTARVEAFTTGGVYSQIKGANLIVVDFGALAITDNVTTDMLRATLDGSGVPWCAPGDFADSPSRWESRALVSIGAVESLPPKAIAFINYSGGVGKTTCSVDLARYVAERLKLKPLIVELKHGVSSLRALLSADDRDSLPDIYQVLTQGKAPKEWHGITILPMEYRTAKLLAGQIDGVINLLAELKARHILTIFDTEPSHMFWPDVLPLVDEIYALAAPHQDALSNAMSAAEEAIQMMNGRVVPVSLVINQVRGAADKIFLQGVERKADLPFIDTAARYDGQLAERLLPVIYPGWRKV
jgi:MinD-like ATPase involved in chromosome partitioning or flagellar assembly